MWPDRVSNPGPLTYESGSLPIALRGPAYMYVAMGQGQIIPLESNFGQHKKLLLSLSTTVNFRKKLFNL